MPSISEKVQAGLRRNGMTAADCAKASGINERTMRAYANGSRTPSHAARERLEKALKLHHGSLAPGEPVSDLFITFHQKSKLAEDEQLAGVIEFLSRYMSDSELEELGVSTKGDEAWRVFETLASGMQDILQFWRNKAALERSHKLEDDAADARDKIGRR